MKRLTHIERFRTLVALSFSVAAVGIAALLAGPVQSGPASLQATIEDVARRWPQIGHITPSELAPLLQNNAALVFDVREEVEFGVSHIPGAIHVAPDSSPAAFLERYGDAAKGKIVVFFCSVGMRSSALAARVAEGLKVRGATAVDDLAGGIFAWHNQGRAIVDEIGPTDFVHPYDATWGRLLSRQDLLRTVPRSCSGC
jgi:rhodanese-related sulfurtransferase